MTREEIENIPKNVNTLLGLSVTMLTRQKLNEKLNKVCELAVKALKQDPKVDGDAINRQEAIDAIYDHEYKKDMRKAIEALPPVTLQEPKTDVLDKIRAEMESNIETVTGRYDSSTPIYGMPSYKIERNKAREECIGIIDKYRQEG